MPDGASIRSDLETPVFTFVTEFDVDALGYSLARQDDSESFRLWEVPGTSQIDAYTGGGYSLTDLGDGAAEAALLDPTQASEGLLNCAMPMNAGGQHAVLNAALWRCPTSKPGSATAHLRRSSLDSRAQAKATIFNSSATSSESRWVASGHRSSMSPSLSTWVTRATPRPSVGCSATASDCET